MGGKFNGGGEKWREISNNAIFKMAMAWHTKHVALTEREEDLTGPYAYLANKWIAFDDDTSLKIKVGRFLLTFSLTHLGPI